MLEITYGQTRNRIIASQLVEVLEGMNLDGSLYLGYPIIATADKPITVDALLVSKGHGLVAFQFSDISPSETSALRWEGLQATLDRLFVALEYNLSRHDSLRERRRLGFDINTLAVFAVTPSIPAEFGQRPDMLVAGLDGLPAVISSLAAIEERFMRPLQAALQRVTTIKPRKRRSGATKPESRGAILKQIEQEIANLDQYQKRAAIECPEGPQRIRGLAGSGKTIVLALKAAYLHAQHPEWVIAVTFFTRSLYPQFQDLIRRFSFEHLGDEPNWENLRIRHSWGSANYEGLYSEVAKHCGIVPQNYLSARSRYGRRDPFDGICSELLSATSASPPEPLYDAVLIDEAQDLPGSFFRLVYRFTRRPNRIIWAYDELQKLSESSMPSVEDLFGADEQGNLRINLSSTRGQPGDDIVLPRCYRNPPWALTMAHGLGFGTQRPDTLVQHFDDPSMWLEIGYRLVSGELEAGQTVTLERRSDSYPEYFGHLLSPEDGVLLKTFDDEFQQAEWVADSISRNLREDQLELDDILVVLPSAYYSKRDAAPVMEALGRRKIDSHLAGVTTSPDEIFTRTSIALAHIHRSKGNEAAMVYVINAQRCVEGPELIALRNTLFTAITRSRAWVRICGWGPNMSGLRGEFEAIKANGYRLRFRIPTSEELAKIRQIHRELTADERGRAQKAERELRSLVEALEKGDVSVENLPVRLRVAIAKHFSSVRGLDEDSEPDSNGTP